jgi:hypothetical protein
MANDRIQIELFTLLSRFYKSKCGLLRFKVLHLLKKFIEALSAKLLTMKTLNINKQEDTQSPKIMERSN